MKRREFLEQATLAFTGLMFGCGVETTNENLKKELERKFGFPHIILSPEFSESERKVIEKLLDEFLTKCSISLQYPHHALEISLGTTQSVVRKPGKLIIPPNFLESHTDNIVLWTELFHTFAPSSIDPFLQNTCLKEHNLTMLGSRGFALILKNDTTDLVYEDFQKYVCEYLVASLDHQNSSTYSVGCEFLHLLENSGYFTQHDIYLILVSKSEFHFQNFLALLGIPQNEEGISFFITMMKYLINPKALAPKAFEHFVEKKYIKAPPFGKFNS